MERNKEHIGNVLCFIYGQSKEPEELQGYYLKAETY